MYLLRLAERMVQQFQLWRNGAFPQVQPFVLLHLGRTVEFWSSLVCEGFPRAKVRGGSQTTQQTKSGFDYTKARPG